MDSITIEPWVLLVCRQNIKITINDVEDLQSSNSFYTSCLFLLIKNIFGSIVLFRIKIKSTVILLMRGRRPVLNKWRQWTTSIKYI